MALTKPVPQSAEAAAAVAAAPASATVTPALASNAPKFESPDETEGTAAASAPAEQPAPSTSTAVAAKPASTALASRTEASAFAKEVEAMKGAADFRYGNYTVFKGNNGSLVQTGGGAGNLGRWAKVSMIAWDEHYEVSPGSDTEASKMAVGYSKEGVVMDSIIGEKYRSFVGKPVQDYVDFLRGDGDYPKASKGRFIDVACVVHEADSDDSFNGEIIQVTLSQSSIPSFSSYQEQLIMKAKAAARGLPVSVPEDPFTFYFLRELASKDGKNWTKLKVVTKLPAKI